VWGARREATAPVNFSVISGAHVTGYKSSKLGGLSNTMIEGCFICGLINGAGGVDLIAEE